MVDPEHRETERPELWCDEEDTYTNLGYDTRALDQQRSHQKATIWRSCKPEATA